MAAFGKHAFKIYQKCPERAKHPSANLQLQLTTYSFPCTLSVEYLALRGLYKILGIEVLLAWRDFGWITSILMTHSFSQLYQNRTCFPTSVMTPAAQRSLDEWRYPKYINTQNKRTPVMAKSKLFGKPSRFLTVLSPTHSFCNHLVYYVRPASRGDYNIIIKHRGSNLFKKELGRELRREKGVDLKEKYCGEKKTQHRLNKRTAFTCPCNYSG